ncbi:chromodomain-helicase-DNA-binding protein 1-like [Acanthaster planci]|uniref:Chromodomain-helicase-DNA-binding protein 1-like n=1 Tax=Acanthaster planci TaxID=133434 RepID=A0A8B7YDC0_ACAPL|nr:chromodomain-helicase-DNA-binding protein 1-like [Acanthaster planci]
MDRIRRKISDLGELKNADRTFVDGNAMAKFGLTGITYRPYQIDGLNWLIQRYHRNHGCILGDEMGLGKTCQTIGLLTYLFGSGKSQGPFLILSPLSVMGNWKDELERFSPKLKFFTYMGDKTTREELQSDIRHSNNWQVLLTTYELCLNDAAFLQKFSWEVLIVDEAHRLKNRSSLLHQTLKEFTIGHSVLLTGTPVQNNLTELYSLLSFVAPGIFRSSLKEKFLEEYENMTDDAVKNDLHSILLPFLLRRTKNEVVLDIPKKSEVILYHGLSALQKKLYKAVLTKDYEAFQEQDPASQRPKTRLMNVLMQLRKVVDHPYLFDGVEPEPFQLGEHLVDSSGKLHLLDKLLTFLKQRNHKVLLFSQMTRMLDILQDYLGFRGYSYERLDGSVRSEERFLAIRNFNEQDETFAFLLSTKAGGQGLNLVAADTVIFVDSDFNPQNDLQAAARAHRIGQTRPVKIIRLVGKDSVEEIIIKRADAKLKLTNQVIEGGQFSLGGVGPAESATQLSEMLKFGLDQLLQSADSSIDDVDLQGMLGSSVDGQWVEEEVSSTQHALEEGDEEMEGTSEGDLYVFEGKDYSKEPVASNKDREAFEALIAAELAEQEDNVQLPRALRKHRNINAVPDLPLPQRKKKEYTPEELEERKRKREEAAIKRQEAAAKKAKLMEEAFVRRMQERRQKLDKLWEANDYESANIAMETDEEDEEEEEDDLSMLDDGNEVRTIQYVSGDVTQPINTGDRDAIVVHCVDDSGSWGKGGLFTALQRRSDQPETQYELAGKMQDLALGDAHLIGIDDKMSRSKGNDMVALIIAQHRDKRNNLSGIKMYALNQGLQRVYKAAKERNASVHLPRIGYATPGFNWYGTEKLIHKLLASKGISTYIYYFPRHRSKRPSTSPQVPRHKPHSSTPSSDTSVPSTSTASPSTLDVSGCDQSDAGGLPSFLRGVTVTFCDLAESEVKKLTRYIVAYDGDVSETVSDQTTHIIADEETAEAQALMDMKAENSDAVIVSARWLQDCIAKQSHVSVDNYRM